MDENTVQNEEATETFRELNPDETAFLQVLEGLASQETDNPQTNQEFAVSLFGENIGTDMLERIGAGLTSLYAQTVQSMPSSDPTGALVAGSLSVFMKGVELGRTLEKGE